jgi:hypothetical protein
MRKINTPTKTRPLFIDDLGQVTGGCGGSTQKPAPIVTLAIGEEDGAFQGPVVSTQAVGEEDGSGGDFTVTTLALGEEDGGFGLF